MNNKLLLLQLLFLLLHSLSVFPSLPIHFFLLNAQIVPNLANGNSFKLTP